MCKCFNKYFGYLKKQQGFSLIELSVVISVAAAATVGVLSWTQPTISTNSTKAIETRHKMQEVQKSIEAFRVRTKRLPCPADPLMRSDSTRSSIGTDYITPTATSHDYYINNFGMEDLDTTQSSVNGVDTRGVDCPVSVGAIPVFSLGLDESYMHDAWGRRMTYHVAPTLCGADTGVPGSPTATDISISQSIGCTDNDYKNKTGNITVTNGSTTLTTSSAFVLVSHGANGAGAFLPSGTKLAASGNANEAENSNGDTTYIKADQNATFDDIVIFATRNQIESQVNRKNIKNISVTDCETNSQVLKNITLTEAAAMTSVNSYTQHSGAKNTGDQILLGILKNTQNICISYYGASAATINGKTWSGAQCPGNNNPGSNGSTYLTTDGSCLCDSGLWDGNCTTTFTPKSISGLQLWIDANDSTTLFTDLACMDGSPANNASIKCWKDKSGNTNNAIGINAPIYKTNSMNGKAIIRFDGQNLLVGTSLLNSINTGNVTVFIVAKNSDIGNSVLVGVPDISEVRFNIHLPWSDENIYWDFGYMVGGGGGRIFNYWGGYEGTTYVWTFNAAYGSGVGSQNIWRNGTRIQSNTTSKNPSYGTTYGLSLGGKTGAYFSGDLAEITIYNTALSDTERQNIETYLKTKWGI